jgi:hypothetical protein
VICIFHNSTGFSLPDFSLGCTFCNTANGNIEFPFQSAQSRLFLCSINQFNHPITNAMKTKIHYLGFLITGLLFLNPCTGQVVSDSILAHKAYTSLKRAAILNGISLAFGIASNVEMAVIGGFPIEYEGGMNPAVNISHAIICAGRISFSIFPPINVSKARKTLKLWRESPEMARSCEKLFSYMDAAQVLTAAAPVLCVAGGMMMAFGSEEQVDYTYPYDDYHALKHPALKTFGWICVGAGLVSSLSAAVLISLSKHELAQKMGSLKMKAGPTGVGMIYTFPGDRSRILHQTVAN